MKGVVSDTKINGVLTANAINDYFSKAYEARLSPISDYSITSEKNQQNQSM